jgi:hypothetical protein
MMNDADILTVADVSGYGPRKYHPATCYVCMVDYYQIISSLSIIFQGVTANCPSRNSVPWNTPHNNRITHRLMYLTFPKEAGRIVFSSSDAVADITQQSPVEPPVYYI